MEKLRRALAGLQVKDDRTGNTALHKAVLQNNYEEVKSLLSSGVDVNCQDEEGNTPLHMAIKYNCTDIAQLLINTPAIKINQGNIIGSTPLLWAAARGRDAMVKVLIHRGADPNIRGWFDFTPLHAACRWGYTDVAAVLLSRPEIDISIVNVFGRTALQRAKDRPHLDIIEMLRCHVSPVPGDRAAGETVEQSVCPPCQINKATNTSTPCQINKATNTSTLCQINKATNTSTPCQINKATNTSTLCQKCCSTIEHCPQCGMTVCTVDEFTKMENLSGAATGLQVKDDRTGNTPIHEAVSQSVYPPCQINKATNTSTPCQINKATNTSTLCQKCCSTIEHCPQCGMTVCTVDEFRYQKPNEKVLWKVAGLLGINWYAVGIQLEVPSIELDKIEHDNPKSVVKQAFHMLHRWCEKCEPEECTIATLKEALNTADCFEALCCLDSEKN